MLLRRISRGKLLSFYLIGHTVVIRWSYDSLPCEIACPV